MEFFDKEELITSVTNEIFKIANCNNKILTEDKVKFIYDYLYSFSNTQPSETGRKQFIKLIDNENKGFITENMLRSLVSDLLYNKGQNYNNFVSTILSDTQGFRYTENKYVNNIDNSNYRKIKDTLSPKNNYKKYRNDMTNFRNYDSIDGINKNKLQYNNKEQ